MKVACPRCGKPGYLTKVRVRDRYYMRVDHHEGGRRTACYLGRDVEELRRYVEQLADGSSAFKVVKVPGSDFHIADLLHPRIERLCPKRCTFVEVFGGSGYMSQTVSRQKFGNVVYNDINNMLVALYRHVKESPERLAFVASLLPYSRVFHGIIKELLREGKDLAPFVVAALAFYALNASFFGTYDMRGFAYSVNPHNNEARAYRSRVASILKYAERWKDVVIENLDFRDVIKKYDSENTVFYLDPPFVGRDAETYDIKFTVSDLREMALILTQIRGAFLLKLDRETYELISDVLTRDRYVVETFERTLHMGRVRDRRRDKWLLTLVSSR
ncbi:MAG: DNA adenine methylase [Pyrobaculum sp.]